MFQYLFYRALTFVGIGFFMVLVRSIVTVSSFTMVSRILGFCRDILIAAFLGAGVLADVFFVAFKIPNLFRRLFAEGAFNAAFVPQFSGILEHEGKINAKVFAEQALAVLLWSMLIFVVFFSDYDAVFNGRVCAWF